MGTGDEIRVTLLNNLWAVAPGLGFPFGQCQPGGFCGYRGRVWAGKPLGHFFHQWCWGSRIGDLHCHRCGKGVGFLQVFSALQPGHCTVRFLLLRFLCFVLSGGLVQGPSSADAHAVFGEFFRLFGLPRLLPLLSGGLLLPEALLFPQSQCDP